MAYTTINGDNIGTRLVSVRIRRDLLEYIEMQQLNRNQLINDALAFVITMHQHGIQAPKIIGVSMEGNTPYIVTQDCKLAFDL
mgnify:CR=1 FL=1